MAKILKIILLKLTFFKALLLNTIIKNTGRTLR